MNSRRDEIEDIISRAKEREKATSEQRSDKRFHGRAIQVFPDESGSSQNKRGQAHILCGNKRHRGLFG